MPLFLIERNYAERIESLEPELVRAIEQVNGEVGVNWLFSFLSADKRKTYCLYEAKDADALRAAALRLGLPADVIVEVSEVNPGALMGRSAPAT